MKDRCGSASGGDRMIRGVVPVERRIISASCRAEFCSAPVAPLIRMAVSPVIVKPSPVPGSTIAGSGTSGGSGGDGGAGDGAAAAGGGAGAEAGTGAGFGLPPHAINAPSATVAAASVVFSILSHRLHSRGDGERCRYRILRAPAR